MGSYCVPPFPRRAIRTAGDARAAFALIALAAFLILLFPGPSCTEGGATSGRPITYYSACNDGDGTNPTEWRSSSALVADFAFWGLVVVGLAYTWNRRSVLRRAEATPAAPPEPGPPQMPPSP
jgi:hypothetical protein